MYSREERKLQGDSTTTMSGVLNVDGGTLKLSGNERGGTFGVTLGKRGTLTLDNSGTNLTNRTAGA